MPMLSRTESRRPWIENGLRTAPTRRSCDVLGDLRAAGLDQDGELVAAEPRRQLLGTHVAAQALGEGDEQLVAGRVAEVVVDRLEPVQVDEEHDRLGAVGRCALERLVDAGVEEAPVRQARERVVERLVAELRLEIGELGERLLELLVLEQQRRVAREGAEELLVLLSERRHLVGAVADEQHAEQAVLAHERGEDRVLEAALGQVGVERRPSRRSRAIVTSPPLASSASSAPRSAADMSAGSSSELAVRPHRAAERPLTRIERQHQELGVLGAEQSTRGAQQLVDAGVELGRVLAARHRVVERLDVVVAAALEPVGAQSERAGGGRQEQRGRPRTGRVPAMSPRPAPGWRPSACPGTRRPRSSSRARWRDAPRRATRQRRRGRSRSPPRARPRPARRASPPAGTRRVPSTIARKMADRERRAQRALGEVEDDLERPLAAVEDERRAHADELRGDEPERRHREEAEHERHLAQRQRVRLAAEVHVDDGALGEEEADRERPPGDGQLVDGRRQVAGRQEHERGGRRDGGGEQPDPGRARAGEGTRSVEGSCRRHLPQDEAEPPSPRPRRPSFRPTRSSRTRSCRTRCSTTTSSPTRSCRTRCSTTTSSPTRSCPTQASPLQLLPFQTPPDQELPVGLGGRESRRVDRRAEDVLSRRSARRRRASR